MKLLRMKGGDQDRRSRWVPAFAGAIGLWCAFTLIAHAQPTVVSPQPDEIALTIYRDDLALVIETRRVDLPAGVSTISFEGVNDRIIPQSALLNEFGAISIERNFDFDLITPAAFFEKSVGKDVTVTRTNRASGRATRTAARIISSAPGQGVVLQTAEGFEAYQCSGLPEQISATEMPANLRAKPTLSLMVSAEEAGPQEIVISYLASGFEWEADYVMNLTDADSASLLGWLTVNNNTSSSIENAETAIVAGNLQRGDETYAEPISGSYFAARCWPRGSTKKGSRERIPLPAMRDPGFDKRSMAAAAPEAAYEQDAMIVVTGSRIARQEELGDYKLYRTPEPTSVAAYQTKQVVFLEKAEIDYGKRYVFELETPEDAWGDEDDPEPAAIEYRIDNSRKGKLAQPLPAGNVRAFADDGTRSYFLGEDSISDLAVDLPVKPRVASATDVQMLTRILKREEKPLKGGDVRRRIGVEHTITNASSEAALVEVSVGKGFPGAMKIEGASIRTEKSERVPTWLIKVEPQSSKTLTYRATWIE